jgi:hypothetical protein
MMVPRRMAPFSILVVALFAAGCASAGGGSAGGTISQDRDLITSEELSTVFVPDLYEALQRLRPLWLQSRGARTVNLETQIAVVVNGLYVGALESLREIPLGGVTEVRRLDAATATATIAGISGPGRVIDSAIVVRIGSRND